MFKWFWKLLDDTDLHERKKTPQEIVQEYKEHFDAVAPYSLRPYTQGLAEYFYSEKGAKIDRDKWEHKLKAMTGYEYDVIYTPFIGVLINRRG